MTTEHADNQTNTARDERGRFTAGNRGGPGNPFARQVSALRQAILDCVTPQDMQEVIGALLILAKAGDIQAARLLLSYAIGKPQPAPEPDRMDADEWERYRETTPMKQESAAVVGAGVPEFHLEQARTVRPLVTQLMQLQVEETVREEMTPPQEEEFTEDEPLPNGDNGEPLLARNFEELMASIPNGKKSPSSKGGKRAAEPSTNGDKRAAAPSANGDLTDDRLASPPR